MFDRGTPYLRVWLSLLIIPLLLSSCTPPPSSIFEDKARKALRQHDYSEAEKYFIVSFKEVERLDFREPSHQEILTRHLWGLAEALKAQGRYSEIIPYLRRVVLITNKHDLEGIEIAKSLDTVATFYSDLGQQEAAEPILINLSKIYSKEPKIESLVRAVRTAHLKQMDDNLKTFSSGKTGKI